MQPKTALPKEASNGMSIIAHIYTYASIGYVSSLQVVPRGHEFKQNMFMSALEQLMLENLYNKDYPVFAITNDNGQAEQCEILESKCSFHRLLRFTGTYGNPLSLWVKPRIGDRKSTRGPLVKPIKNKSTAPLLGQVGIEFAGCCGARVLTAAESHGPESTRWPEYHQYFPGCLRDRNEVTNLFMLCEESTTEVVDTLKDTGYVPIYRYSTPEGVTFLMLFRTSGRSDVKQAPVLYGRTEKPIIDIIKRLQGIKT
jgi:hypothetical protein